MIELSAGARRRKRHRKRVNGLDFTRENVKIGKSDAVCQAEIGLRFLASGYDFDQVLECFDTKKIGLRWVKIGLRCCLTINFKNAFFFNQIVSKLFLSVGTLS